LNDANVVQICVMGGIRVIFVAEVDSKTR